MSQNESTVFNDFAVVFGGAIVAIIVSVSFIFHAYESETNKVFNDEQKLRNTANQMISDYKRLNGIE